MYPRLLKKAALRASRLLLAFTCVLAGLHAQTSTWTGAISSAWDTPGNWNPATVPNSGINAIIANVATQPSTVGALNPTCLALTVNAGADLGIDPTVSLTVEGDSTLNGTISGGGVLIADGTGTVSAPGGNPYPNIDVAGAYTLVGGVTVTGDLQQLMGAGSLGFAGGTVTVNGNASFAGAGVADSASSTLHVDGNVSFQTTAVVTMPPSVLEVGGDWDSDANFTPGSGEVVFVGTSVQTVTATPSVIWFDLRIVEGADVTMALDVTTTRDLTVRGQLRTSGSAIQVGRNCILDPPAGGDVLIAQLAQSVSIGGAFSLVRGVADFSMASLSVSGNTTISFLATLSLGPFTHTFSGGFSESFLSTLNVTGSTFLFDGSGSIASQSSLPDVDISGTYTLQSTTIAGTLHQLPRLPGLPGEGVLSFNGDPTVTGDALFEGVSLLEISPAGSTLTIGGNASMQTTAVVDTPPDSIVVDGNWTSNANWLPASGAVTLTNPAPTVTATAFNTTSVAVGSNAPATLNVSQSLSVTGTLTVLGTFSAPPTSLTVTGDLSLPMPTDTLTLSPGSNQVSGSVTNNGIINGTGTLTLTGTGTISGSGSYGNLAINTSGTITGGNVTGSIDGSLDLLAGTFDLAPGSTVRITGQSTFSGGIVSGDPSALLDLDGNAFWLGAEAGSTIPMIAASGDWTSDATFDPPLNSTVTLDSGLDLSSQLSPAAAGGVVNFDTLVIAGNTIIAIETQINARIISILMGGALGIGTGANDDGLDAPALRVTLLGSQMSVSGTLSIGTAELCLENDSIININNPSGVLRMIGTPNLPATICGPPCGNYQVTISGLLKAVNFEFNRMGPSGIRILEGARFGARPLDMRAGRFVDGSSQPRSVQLSIATSMDMDFRDITFIRSTTGMPEFNVRSTPTTGLISFTNAAGNFAGETFEDDPTRVIDWPDDLRTTLVGIHARAGVGRIGIKFESQKEVDVASFHLMRATNPAGPFSDISGPITPIGSETVGAEYAFLDQRVLHPTRYHYRLEEELIFGRRRMLGEASAIPLALDLGDSVFVGNGGLRTIAEGIDAVPIGGNVIVAPGTYPAFTTNKPVRILSDGNGPVWIDTRFMKLIVRDIPAGAPDLAFYDIHIGLPDTDGTAGMEIINCDNVIVLDKVAISNGFGTTVKIEDCPQVALQGCRLSGLPALEVLANSTVAVSGGSVTSIRIEDNSTVVHLATDPGAPTVIQSDPSATVTGLAGTAPRLEFPMLWPTNSTQTLDIAGDPGDTWMLLRGTGKDFTSATQYMPSDLYLLLDLSTLTTPDMGVVGSDGRAQSQVVIPDMPELWGMSVPYQLLIQGAAGRFRFGNVRDQVFMPN